MEEGGVACVCCVLVVLLIFGIYEIVVNSATHMPTFHIQDFYVPALNTRLPTFNSTTATATFIFFNLELKNEMSQVGVLYGDVHVTFYYGTSTNSTTSSIANYTVPGFYQGHGKTAHRRDVVDTVGVPWLDAFATVSNGSRVVFRVELSTRVKPKHILGSYSRGEVLLVGGNVEVNGFGEKVQNKGIKLKQIRFPHHKAMATQSQGNLDGVVNSDVVGGSVYSA